MLAQAETRYRAERTLSVSRLLTFHRKQGGGLRTPVQVVDATIDDGWALDGDQLLPMAGYCSGHLWSSIDRAEHAAEGGDVLYADPFQQLLEVIPPAVFEDIEGVSPRQGWVPLDLVAG